MHTIRFISYHILKISLTIRYISLLLIISSFTPTEPHSQQVTYRDQGNLLLESGKYIESIHYYKLAMQLAEKEFGPNHLMVSDALIELGYAIFLATHSTSAEPFFVRALQIRKARLGDHEETAKVLDLIALVRFANAEAVSAEGIQGDAYRMRKRIFDANTRP